MAFYGTLATASSWIVPKKYVEKVGDDGFKKQPIGLGPYKFVSSTPGIEIVMEANESYWRKMPSVKRLVFKSVPEATTRAAMLKKGEVDVAYLLDAPTALELDRDPLPGLLRPVGSEVSVGRQTRAARGRHGGRSPVAERSREPGRVASDGQP